MIADNGYHYLLSTQYDGRYGHMVWSGEGFEGRIIEVWIVESDYLKGALREGNNIGIGKSYSGTGSIGAVQGGKRGQDIPFVNTGPAQDERYTRNPGYPSVDSSSEFNQGAVRSNI